MPLIENIAQAILFCFIGSILDLILALISPKYIVAATPIFPFKKWDRQPYTAVFSEIFSRHYFAKAIFIGDKVELKDKKGRQTTAVKKPTKSSQNIKNEDHYRVLVSGIVDYAIIMLDLEGNILTWNPGAQRIKGYLEEEILGRNFQVFYTEEDRKRSLPMELLGKARNLGEVVDERWRVRKDGSLFWGSVLITALYDLDGTISGFAKVTRDLTEAKTAEEEIKVNEKKLHMMLDAMGDDAWEHNFATGHSVFSKNIKKIIGFEVDEMSPDNLNKWLTHVLVDDRHLVIESDRKYKSGEQDHHLLEYRMRHKDGSIKWILDRGVVLSRDLHGKPLKVIGTHSDITERKVLEINQIENENRFKDLTQNVPGVIFQWEEKKDGSFGFTYISPKLKDYFQLEPSENSKFIEYIHPEDKKAWRLSLEESSKNKLPWFFEGRILYPDSTIKFWRGASLESKHTDDGTTIYNGILLDLTEEKEAAIRIESQAKRFEGIFNSTHQLIGFLSPEGILLEVNDTALMFGGIRPEDVIGKPLWECHWCQLHPELFKDLLLRAVKGESIQQNVEARGANNSVAWVDFTLKPIFNDRNEVIYVIPEGRDITQHLILQKLNQEQEEKFRLFVKHTPAAVAMFDNEMKYIAASDRWYADYGLGDKIIIGESHYDIFPETFDNREFSVAIKRCLLGSIECADETPFQLLNGISGFLKWEMRPWKRHDDSIGGMILFTESVTEKVEVRENLKKLNMQLVSSNQELEQFAYIASHDLEEPLRMVSSFLQLLVRKYGANLDSIAHEYINFALDGSDRMKSLIKDLLAFSRVGSGQLKLEKVNLGEVFEDTRSLLQSTILEKAAILWSDSLPTIDADNVQIRQVLQNLVGNALKYSQDIPPKIEIAFSEDVTHWMFSVKDNGIGIDSRYFNKIFVVFQRLHTRSSYAGTGIGLAICKKIVERHAGRIWVESTLGNGSTFYFTISKSLRGLL